MSTTKVPCDILEVQEPSILNKWLSVFVAEAQNKNGEPYTPRSLLALFLFRYMRDINPQAHNILDKNHPQFREFHYTVDGLFKKLRSEGIGSAKQSAEAFSKEEENTLLCGKRG